MEHKKHLFDLPESVTYLNIAGFSPSTNAVNEAGLEGLKQKRHPYLITGTDFFEPTDALKKLFAKLIEANDYNRIALIPSASYGIATVANNIVLKPTDEILIIGEQFPSNYYSWERLADKYNATIKVVKMPKNTDAVGKQWNKAIIEAINDNTAVVTMGNIHWSNGTLFDLKAIRKKTRWHDALLIIDGSQSIGALPFSVAEIEPDALICAGYKWLFGPYGCGYAYYSDYFDNGTPIEENWSTRKDSDNFGSITNYTDQYRPLANRYSSGESASFINVKMQTAALKQVLEWTPKVIQDYCKQITTEAVKALRILGLTIEHDAYRAHHLFGITLPDNTNIDKLKLALAEEKITVSFIGNKIRVSCHLYNTAADFNTFTNCLASVLNQ